MNNKNILSRLYWYIGFSFLALCVVIGKLIYLQEKEPDGKKYYQYEYSIPHKRGSIYTSDKFEIALDVEYSTMKVDPLLFEDENEVDLFIEVLKAAGVELDFDKARSEILSKRKKGNRIYDFDGILLSSETQKKILEEKAKYNKNFKNRIVYFDKFFDRKYIDNNVFETIVGFLDFENKPKYGLELKYEDVLKGKDGRVRGTSPNAPSNAQYTLPYLIDQEVLEEGKDGDSLVLSLNSVLQYSLDEILKKAHEDFKAVTTMGIVMEVETGRIIAMDSFPKATNKGEIKNHNISNLFEPGSIFKPITVAAAINDGKINENTLISSDGFIKVKNRIIRDHDNSTKGIMSVSNIIAHSGNVGLVKIGQLLKPETFYSYLEDFGLGSKTGLDLPYETNRKLFSFKDFTEVRRSNVSFGQGISMTQMQIITALNATINGGKLIQPRLVDRIVDKEGNIVKENGTVVNKTVISEGASKQIRNMLANVVNTGTGKAVKIDGYSLGGKTGTAQKAGVRGYEPGKYFSSFYTYFPAKNPKYAILVTVDEPSGAYYGATVALPVAKEMVDKLIKYYNIAPDLPAELEKNKKDEKVEVKEVKVNRNSQLDVINQELSLNLMPDLTGVTRKNLMNIPNLSKYKLVINGNGKVVNQMPKLGSVIEKGSVITLELE